MEAFYSSSNEFYVAGDQEASFNAGRRVKIDCGVDGTKYATVVSSSFGGVNTYVTIGEPTITPNIVTVLLGLIQAGLTGSLPDHQHTATSGDGGDTIRNAITANTNSIATTANYLNSRIDTLSGTIANYDTVWVPANDMITTTTSGATAGTNEYSPNYVNTSHFVFSKASETLCNFDLVFKDGWDLGDIKAKIYWSSASGSTVGDAVVWKISSAKIADSTDIGSVSGIPQVVSGTLTANDGTDLQITSATPYITVGGTPAKGDLIHFRVSRDVIDSGDTMSESAWLLGVLIQYHNDNTAVIGW